MSQENCTGRRPASTVQADEVLRQVLVDYAHRSRRPIDGAEAADPCAAAIDAIRQLFAPDLERIQALTAERDEADRRAGAAERLRARDQEDLARLEQVQDRRKQQWGVSWTVSFDVVWAEALALKAAAQSRLGLPTDQEPKYTTDGWHIVNRASGKAIPHDEPVFIFRARDVHALEAIEAYAGVLQAGDHRDAVKQRLADFARFAETFPDRMKQPDTASPAAAHD